MSEREATASAEPVTVEEPVASPAAPWRTGNGPGGPAASGETVRSEKSDRPTPRPPAGGPAVAPPSPGGRRASYAWAAVSVLAIAAVVTLSIVFGSAPLDEPWNAGADSPAPVSTTEDAGTAAVPTVPSVDGSTEAGQTAGPSTGADSDVLDGDLGLSIPISSPACDSTWVVFVGAATDPATYAAQITTLLEGNRGSQYLLTRGGCSSMRQELPDGSQIYSVYLGPFPDQATACTVQAGIGGLSYVKRMDDETPPDQLWEC